MLECHFLQVLGESDQEPELRVRPWEGEHRRLVPQRRRTDLHGRLQHVRPPTWYVSCREQNDVKRFNIFLHSFTVISSGKDSPSSKLLYAKDIPIYKDWVTRYYQV